MEVNNWGVTCLISKELQAVAQKLWNEWDVSVGYFLNLNDYNQGI